MLKPRDHNDIDELVERPRRFLAAEILRIGSPILILIGGIIGFSILTNLRGAPAVEKQVIAPPLVATLPVELHGQGVDMQVDGIVVPYREISVATEVGGRVKFKADSCRAGNYVNKGKLLIEIDPVDYQLEVDRLEMELEQAKVMLNELDVQVLNTQELIALAKKDLELQRQELERLRSLEGEQIVSQTQVDQAAHAELTARNALLSLNNQLRLLKAGRERLVQGQKLVGSKLEKAELDRRRTQIAAPTDGVVVQDLIEQDSYVQKGASLFKLEDTSSVEVKCSLQMKELFWVLQQSSVDLDQAKQANHDSGYHIPNTPVTVIYRLGGREYAWDGVLSRYDGLGLNERTRTVPCRVVVDQPRGGRPLEKTDMATNDVVPPTLMRGMYVSVLIHTQPRIPLLSIPEQAVQPGNVVWLVENGKLRRKQIEPAQLAENRVLVDQQCAEFRPGARIVVSPLPNAYDGMTVREKQSS